MLLHRIKDLTLDDFDLLERAGLGSLLAPSKFLTAVRHVGTLLKVVYLLGRFVGRKPTEKEFVESVEKEDLQTMRKALIAAYRDFFLRRARYALKDARTISAIERRPRNSSKGTSGTSRRNSPPSRESQDTANTRSEDSTSPQEQEQGSNGRKSPPSASTCACF